MKSSRVVINLYSLSSTIACCTHQTYPYHLSSSQTFSTFSNVFNLSQCIEFNSVLLIYQSQIVSYIFLNFPLTLSFVLYSVGRITSGTNGAGSVPVGSLFDIQGDTQKDTQAQASTHTDSGNFSNATLYNDHNHIQLTICVISFAFLVATSNFTVARPSAIHMICYVMFCFVGGKTRHVFNC